jgi:hypothetical protein
VCERECVKVCIFENKRNDVEELSYNI